VARHPIDGETLQRVLEIARDAGWTIETIHTERGGHATELSSKAAADGVDVVIVHGGDGTLNEVVNGLAGTETAVAVLRGGTANVWAKETQCPKDPIASMRAIVGGRRRHVDLGRAESMAGSRYFLLMCGVGLDAAIIPAVSPRWKRRLGALSYIVGGIIMVFRTKAWRVDMEIDGEASERSLYWMLAGNTRSYGGVLNVTYLAVADDGLLDIALMRKSGIHRVIMDGVRALFRRHARSSNVRYVSARAVEITTAGIPVQVDGEEHGETPLRIEVVPLALHVIVPRELKSPLFSKDHIQRGDAEARSSWGIG
jgi:YegS/Rv2252/BmrU family lipid kinase